VNMQGYFLTCMRVDEPESTRQKGSDHKGSKSDANHSRGVQHIYDVCEKEVKI